MEMSIKTEALEELLSLILFELKRSLTPPLPPMLFHCYCERCQQVTTHMSHLSPTREGAPAMTGQVNPPVEPLKTCLNCGLLTDKEL